MARVTYYEIPAENPEASKQFYREVFGWNFDRFGEEEYWLTDSGNPGEKGIEGAIMKRKDPAQPVTVTIEVTDLDETADRIRRHGGTIVVPRMAIPGVGWAIFFKDPDNHILGVFEPDPDAG